VNFLLEHKDLLLPAALWSSLLILFAALLILAIELWSSVERVLEVFPAEEVVEVVQTDDPDAAIILLPPTIAKIRRKRKARRKK
jgi:hypothetical protein